MILKARRAPGGLRPTGMLTIAEADGALRDRPDGSLLIVDVAAEQQPEESALLARIDVEAGWRERSAVVSFGPAALDRVVAQISAPYANLL